MDYSPFEIYDSLKRQGYDDNVAYGVAYSNGGKRVAGNQLQELYGSAGLKNVGLPEGDDGKQDSNFMPLVAGNAGYTAGMHYLDKKFPDLPTKSKLPTLRGAGKFLGGSAAYLLPFEAYKALSGNNYYDRSSLPQTVAELAGDIGGATLGAAAGRALGGSLGALGGPLGMFAGSMLGGYLLPKFMPKGSVSAKEDDGTDSQGALSLAALLGAGMLGTRTAKPIRQFIGRQAGSVMPESVKKLKPDLTRLYQSPLGEAHNAGISAFNKKRGMEPTDWYNPGSMLKDIYHSPSYVEGAFKTLDPRLKKWINR